MYYNNSDDFAIMLTTVSNDEIIVSVGVDSSSFDGIYKGIYDKAFVMFLFEKW